MFQLLTFCLSGYLSSVWLGYLLVVRFRFESEDKIQLKFMKANKCFRANYAWVDILCCPKHSSQYMWNVVIAKETELSREKGD